MVDGPNVYAYVVNNPVSMWDVLGLCEGAPSAKSAGHMEVMTSGEKVRLFDLAMCLFGLALEFYLASKAQGGKTNSVGYALAFGAAAAFFIGGFLMHQIIQTWLFENLGVGFPDDLAWEARKFGAGAGGAAGLATGGVYAALGMFTAITVAGIAMEVLMLGGAAAMAGAGCAAAAQEYLMGNGMINDQVSPQ